MADEVSPDLGALYAGWQEAFRAKLADGADPAALAHAMVDIAVLNLEAAIGPQMTAARLVTAAHFFVARTPTREEIAAATKH